MNRIVLLFLVLGLSLVPVLCWAAQPNADQAKAPGRPQAVPPGRTASVVSDIQGEWMVVSSTGKPNRGHVFKDLVKRTPVTISGDKMSWVEGSGRDSRDRDVWIRISKRIVPRPDVSPIAVDLKPDFPEHKTWSRVAIVKSRGDEMDLCVNFPQGPRPDRFEGADDGREHVVLRRVITKDEK